MSGRAGFPLEAVKADAPVTPDGHMVNGCPKYGAQSVMLTICRACEYFGGYVDTGNRGSALGRYRVNCMAPMPRKLHLVQGERGVARVACPLIRFTLRNHLDCMDCPQFKGVKRTRLRWYHLLRVPRLLCAHPCARTIEEIR